MNETYIFNLNVLNDLSEYKLHVKKDIDETINVTPMVKTSLFDVFKEVDLQSVS
jgi:hypothetical protein